MNQRDIKFLSSAYTRYYGRLDFTKIDIKEVSRYLQRSNMKQKNPFLCYAITQKSDQQKRQDVITFSQLAIRLNSSLLGKTDGMSLETMLQTLDIDKDGFIGIKDVLNMNQELGMHISQQKLAQIMEKITEQGTKITKNELPSILF